MELSGIRKSVIEKFRHQAQQMLFFIKDVVEVEQLQQKETILFLLQLW